MTRMIRALALFLFFAVSVNTTAFAQSAVLLCDQFPGADAGAKIAACIAALPVNSGQSAGGIADARGFGATTQIISSQLDIGASGKPVTLLVNPATKFLIRIYNSSLDAIRVWPGSHIRGEGAGGPSSPGYQGNFVVDYGASVHSLIANWPQDGSQEFFSIEHLMLEATGTVQTGLIYLSGIFAGSYVRDIYTSYCGSGGSALYMTSPTNGVGNITSDISFWNDNFDCGNSVNAGPSVRLVDGGPQSGFGSINFVSCQMQHPGNGQPIEVINGNGSDQNSSIAHIGVHYETSTFGPSVTANYGPFVQITDSHNISFDHVNASGPPPTAGNAITLSQSAPNLVHDIFLRDLRFLGGLNNVVYSNVPGIPSFPFARGFDGAMSIESWSGLSSGVVIGGGVSTGPALINGNLQVNGSSSTINGDLFVNGTLYKWNGAFRIDHPLDPDHKFLAHSFVESPDMKNIYDGIAVLNTKGEAIVNLPKWFQALNKDFRYQLTCIGKPAPVYVAEEVHHNRFRIAGGTPGLRVSWQLTGIRHDRFALEHPIRVEELKSEQEQVH